MSVARRARMHVLLDRMRVNPKIDPEVFELFELLVGAEDERFAPHEATTRPRGSSLGSGELQFRKASAILDAPAAKGREAQARHFAFKTAMSAEDALAALAVAPAAAESESPLDRAMATQDQPRLGAGAPAEGRAAPRAVDTAGIYAARAKASTGR